MKKSLRCRAGLHQWGPYVIDRLDATKSTVTVRHCQRVGCQAFRGERQVVATDEFHKWLRDKCGVPF